MLAAIGAGIDAFAGPECYIVGKQKKIKFSLFWKRNKIITS